MCGRLATPARLHEGAPAAADASSSARTAPRRGRGHPRGQRKATSSTEAPRPPRRSTRRSRSAGFAAWNAALPAVREAAVVFGTLLMTVLTVMRFVPGRATLKNGGGQVRLATTRRRHRPGKGDKCNGATSDCRGGKLNGTGKITLADGGEFEGTFVDNRLDKGMAKNMKVKGDDCRYKTVSLTMSDRPAGAHRVISSWQKINAPKQNFRSAPQIRVAHRWKAVFTAVQRYRRRRNQHAGRRLHFGALKIKSCCVTSHALARASPLFSETVLYTGQIVGDKLNETGKITLANGGEFEGNFVDSILDKGMAKNVKLKVSDGWLYGCTYTGQMAGG
ncbi:hypothetical protein THAOC_36243 [Thalassiosira oceanica]|uniref:Uncharacterized protein n=1 Tax=Thalassiosira oceanica TaxID=159749 RepID=K0R8Q3_THAOC|nr:hypothetical protein THAOC_36243 [Thalassiosira oceanica]|eukprot:EJK45156.1 hypothetical protein THAOC_36243 [Thalassiosira oceanica]